MSKLSLTLQHFQYFILIAEEGSISRIAERMNVSQPLLSQKIAQIEKELGVKLFNRDKRALQLTEAGERFLTDCKSFMASIDQAFDAMGEYQQEHQKRPPVKIGFSDGHTSSRISQITSRLQQSLPAGAFEIEIGNRFLLQERLLNGEIDIYYAVDTEGFCTRKEISYRTLYYLSVSCITSKSSRLAANGSISWDMLDGVTCYFPSYLQKSKFVKGIQKLCQANGSNLIWRFQNVDYFLIRKFLDIDTESITFSLSQAMENASNLKRFPLTGLEYPFIVAWKKTETKRFEKYISRLINIGNPQIK